VILSTQTLPEGVEVCAAADMEEAQVLLAETRAQAAARAAASATAPARTAAGDAVVE
jgi:topoisomerase IA-like protein